MILCTYSKVYIMQGVLKLIELCQGSAHLDSRPTNEEGKDWSWGGCSYDKEGRNACFNLFLLDYPHNIIQIHNIVSWYGQYSQECFFYIFHIRFEIVNPTKHCYGSEKCYGHLRHKLVMCSNHWFFFGIVEELYDLTNMASKYVSNNTGH